MILPYSAEPDSLMPPTLRAPDTKPSRSGAVNAPRRQASRPAEKGGD